MAWISPTGYKDPDSKWTDEIKAYDSNIGTFAYQAFAVPLLTPKYLELTLTSVVLCDRVRIYVAYKDNLFPANFYNPDILIDLFYDGAWRNVKNGIVTKQSWVTVALFGTFRVSKARIKLNGLGTDAWWFLVYEFDFGEKIWRTATMGFEGLAQWRKSMREMPLKVRTVCPICAERLEVHPKTGERHCPFDGWPWQKRSVVN